MNHRVPFLFIRKRQRGSALVITLLLLSLVTAELAILSVVLTRGLGDEGILVSQHIAARRGADVALNQLSERMYASLCQNPATPAGQVFSKAGQLAIKGESLQSLNPETAGQVDATGVTVYAWVKEQRGSFYHLVGQGKIGRIQLSTHRWVEMNPCTLEPYMI